MKRTSSSPSSESLRIVNDNNVKVVDLICLFWEENDIETLIDVSYSKLHPQIGYSSDHYNGYSFHDQRSFNFVSDDRNGEWMGLSVRNIAPKLGCSLPKIISTFSSFFPLHVYVLHLSGLSSSIGDHGLDVTNFQKLISLDLSKNNINDGSILNQVLNLSHLEALNLSMNQIDGVIPERLTDCLQHLKQLDLSYNCLTWIIPSDIFCLRSLSHLNLSHNIFSGRLEISHNCDTLMELNLSTNNISGHIPSEIVKLRQLTHLNLSGNQFSGYLPQFSSRMKLVYLNISENDLVGTLPDMFQNLPLLTTLSLHRNNFSGLIPPSLYSLKSLTYLDLRWNSLSGGLSDDIQHLSQLETLKLNRNRFTGLLPKAIGKLSKLKVLNISYNRFHGSLPMSLKTLTQLTELHLNNNHFSGRLSGEVIRNLTWLEKLDVGYGGTEFVKSLCNISSLKNLTGLNLSGFTLGSKVLSGISTLLSVTYLNLKDTKLSVKSFKDIFPLTKLTSLIISHNDFSTKSSELISWLIDLPQLTKLDVSHCKLNSDFLNHVSNHPSLKQLFASHNEFKERIPDFFYEKDWEALDLSYNKLSVVIPKAIANMKNLKIFRIGNNNINNPLPKEFNQLKKLTDLDLEGINYTVLKQLNFGNCFHHVSKLNLKSCNITNQALIYLCGMINLTSLNLSHNRLNARIPTQINVLKVLTELDISENNFYGPIPTEIIGLERLQKLILSDNNISGSIPKSLYALTQLKCIRLNKNKFTGSILDDEEGIGRLILLETFDLSHNHFEGYIPQGLCNLKLLQHINLSYNSFRGHIPKGIGTLNWLVELRLTHNQLDQEIPDVWSEVRHLKILHLNDNKLHGRMPSTINNLSPKCCVKFDNNMLSGHVFSAKHINLTYKGNPDLVKVIVPKKLLDSAFSHFLLFNYVITTYGGIIWSCIVIRSLHQQGRIELMWLNIVLLLINYIVDVLLADDDKWSRLQAIFMVHTLAEGLKSYKKRENTPALLRSKKIDAIIRSVSSMILQLYALLTTWQTPFSWVSSTLVISIFISFFGTTMTLTTFDGISGNKLFSWSFIGWAIYFIAEIVVKVITYGIMFVSLKGYGFILLGGEFVVRIVVIMVNNWLKMPFVMFAYSSASLMKWASVNSMLSLGCDTLLTHEDDHLVKWGCGITTCMTIIALMIFHFVPNHDLDKLLADSHVGLSLTIIVVCSTCIKLFNFIIAVGIKQKQERLDILL